MLADAGASDAALILVDSSEQLVPLIARFNGAPLGDYVLRCSVAKPARTMK
jgi:hypothetical protein